MNATKRNILIFLKQNKAVKTKLYPVRTVKSVEFQFILIQLKWARGLEKICNKSLTLVFLIRYF